MEARAQGAEAGARPWERVPSWVLVVGPLALIAAAIAAFVALGAPGVEERTGPPIEELAFERTVLRPGEIELIVRNTGPDPVEIAQVSVNDAFVTFDSSDLRLGRLEGGSLALSYPWVEGSPYTISILTSTGATIEHTIDLAAETPAADAGFFGLMAVLGTYVGVIPVILGMFFLPLLRRVRSSTMRVLMAITVGLLGFLVVDASLEGFDIGGASAGAFGGVELLFLGAAFSYLALVGLDRHLAARRATATDAGASGRRLAAMVAIGIGLHNLGEGLAIGAAYSIGALALGTFLVVGFALHNTTEGLAVVAPLARTEGRPGLGRLLALGLIAGGPAIVGAVVGASVYNPELTMLLLGLGIGAIVQVMQQLWPTLRDERGIALTPATVVGVIGGALALYATGLLVTI